MADLIIDTSAGLIKDTKQNTCRDPYDHLGPVEWVDKQIEYGSQEFNISGRGLVPFLQKLDGDLIGCEIGVCHGFSTEYFLKNIPTIKTIYAVDHYPSFVDWDGTRLTPERQEETKRRCKERLSKYSGVQHIYDTSSNFVKTLADESLDFVFVDGDHSYEATLEDIRNYWPKVKKGGLFAGHDINLTTVDRAVKEFFKDIPNIEIKVVENNAWFLTKV